MSISSHIIASLWTAAAVDMSTDEEVTKSERIKMELIVITVVIIISLSIIILLLLLAPLFLERIINSDVSRTRNGGIPQLFPLLAHNVNLYAPTNTNHFKHWRTFGNLLRNIAMIKE